MIINIFLFCLILLFSGCANTNIAVMDEEINIINNQQVGYINNAWNNEATGIDGLSNIVNTKNLPHISITVQTSASTELEVYVSQDCEHFTLCEGLSEKINAATSNSAHIYFTAAEKCYQLKSSNNVTANATISAKP